MGGVYNGYCCNKYVGSLFFLLNDDSVVCLKFDVFFDVFIDVIMGEVKFYVGFLFNYQ